MKQGHACPFLKIQQTSIHVQTSWRRERGVEERNKSHPRFVSRRERSDIDGRRSGEMRRSERTDEKEHFREEAEFTEMYCFDSQAVPRRNWTRREMWTRG
jgi:hypothetical protein